MRKDEDLHGLLGMSTAGQSPCFKMSGGVCEAKDIMLKSIVAKLQHRKRVRKNSRHTNIKKNLLFC